MASERLVTLMELLRIHAEDYVRSSSQLAIFSDLFSNNIEDALSHDERASFLNAIKHLLSLCSNGDLPVTRIPVEALFFALNKPDGEKTKKRIARHFVDTALERLPDEMSTKIYFQLPHSRKELFEEPRKRWEDVIARFPNTIQDIDEASKCFALSRYAACVFHCIQVIEHGLLPLGTFLSVNDPISGWTAVANELKKIINKKHDQRSDFEKRHFPFIEQMQGTVEALKNAWRNKISHAHGQRLLLVDSDFTPDTAEEIMTATRSFMRRLAESLPK